MAPSAERRSRDLERARELDAARDYARVVEMLEGLRRGDLLAEPELGYLLAYAWRRRGETRRALELAVALARPCRRRGRDRLWRRRLNLEGMLRFDLGQLARARLRWAELAEAASDDDDAELAATANNNLGIVAALEGRHDLALGCYERALAAYQRLGDRRGIAQTQQNLAITYRELGLPREADAHFSGATAHARADGSDDVLGRIDQERAVALLFAGDVALARVTARRAYERFLRTDDRAGVADSLRVLGLVSLRSGDVDAAREQLDQALEEARQTGSALTEAETLEALAAAADAEQDETAADARRRDAERLFRSMGAESWGLHARSRLRALLASA